MRKILRYTLLVLLLILLLIVWFNPLGLWKNIQSKNYHTDKNTRSSITYLLESSQWLNFTIPSFTKQIKFIFTANLLGDIDTSENISNIKYSISYSILDKNEKILLSKVHHLRASYLSYLDDNNTLVQKSFYLKSNLKPTTSENIFIDLQRFPTATKIYVKLNHKEDRIADVCIRSYHLENVPKNRQKIKWERLSKIKKEYIARGNVYQPSLMTRQEKELIVSSIWKPNGPIGIEGKSYYTRRLFILKDSDEMHPFVSIEPLIYADKNLSATRYLQEGNYTVCITSLEENQTDIQLKSYNSVQLLQLKHYTLKTEETYLQYRQFEAGIIEIVSNKNVEIKIYPKDEKEEMYLPSLQAFNYYDINQTLPIRYSFYTENERYIQIECYSHTELNTTLNIIMKNKKGETIQTLHPQVEMLTSRYDYRDIFQPITQATTYTILLNSNVNTIDISSEKPLIMRLASRSPTMSYPLYSFKKETQPEYLRKPSWFPLRPQNHRNYEIKKRRVHLFKQPKPPQINPFIASGNYHYEQLFPTHSWRGYALLLKRKLGQQAIRSQSWSNLYSQIDFNKKEHINFYSKSGLTKVTPQLFYKKSNPKLQIVKLYHNKELVSSHKLHQSSGSIVLPSIDTNTSYHFKTDTARETDFYLSHTTDGREYYTKRTFLSFTQPIHFQVKKDSTYSSIGIQLASPYKMSKTLSFFVEINDINDTKNQITTKRTYKKYQLFADSGQLKALNITYPKQELHSSDMLYLTLGENLVNAEYYTITVYPPKEHQHCYLFINHITLGKKSKILLSKEKLLN